MNAPILLASNSQRRKELLAQCNIPFESIASNIDETLDQKLELKQQVQQLAMKKAQVVFDQFPTRVVLAADTMVVYKNHWLGKPKDQHDAISMLKLLSNNTHQVISAVAILTPDHQYSFVEETSVTMRTIEENEIIEYVNSGIPMDKAGAYGIQDVAGSFVERIVGDYYTIVGLPLSKVIPILRKIRKFSD